MPAPNSDSHLTLLSLEEEELESSSLYREVFNAVASAFCVIEMVFEHGVAVDFI